MTQRSQVKVKHVTYEIEIEGNLMIHPVYFRPFIIAALLQHMKKQN